MGRTLVMYRFKDSEMDHTSVGSLLTALGCEDGRSGGLRKENTAKRYTALNGLLADWPNLNDALSDEQLAKLAKNANSFDVRKCYVYNDGAIQLMFVGVEAWCRLLPGLDAPAPGDCRLLCADLLMRAVPGQGGKFKYLAGCAWEGFDDKPEGLYVDGGEDQRLFTELLLVQDAMSRLDELK